MDDDLISETEEEEVTEAGTSMSRDGFDPWGGSGDENQKEARAQRAFDDFLLSQRRDIF